MNYRVVCIVLSLGALAGISQLASAGFIGQPIISTLSLGSVVVGNTTGHTDKNDGFTSGDHFFNIWDGGDDVYKLNWLGGDMQVVLKYNNAICDVDLFVYRPSNLDDSGDYGITNLSPDLVSIFGADPGTYYIVIDSSSGAEGAYELSVIPAPGAISLFAGVGLLAARRRR